MTTEDCPSFEGCSAPLCPIEDNSRFLWYPDEPICPSREHTSSHLLRTQRRIARKCKSTDCYFTGEMIDEMKQVHKGVMGKNPNNPRTAEDSPALPMDLFKRGLKSKLPKKITGSVGSSGHVRVERSKSQS